MGVTALCEISSPVISRVMLRNIETQRLRILPTFSKKVFQPEVYMILISEQPLRLPHVYIMYSSWGSTRLTCINLFIYLPYSGNLSRENTYMNWLKVQFLQRKLFVNCLLVSHQRIPCPQILRRKLSWNLEIHESFLLWKFPAVRCLSLPFCRSWLWF